MAEEKKNNSELQEQFNLVVAELEETKKELALAKAEAAQYAKEYEILSEQNSNLWGVLSNSIEYIVTNTSKKRVR